MDATLKINSTTGIPTQRLYTLNYLGLTSQWHSHSRMDVMTIQHLFFADVEIEVRTASLVDGQIIIDPNPYFEFDDEVEFFGNTGSIIQIEVPESGAYGITIDIEMQDCSICCHGEWEGQCSSYEYYDEGKEIWYCEAGKPQVAVEAIFPEQERPPYNYTSR